MAVNKSKNKVTEELMEKLDIKNKDILKKQNITENGSGYWNIPYYSINNELLDTKQFTNENEFKWEKCISPSVYGINKLKNYSKDYLVVASDELTCIALINNDVQIIAICGDTVSEEVATEVEKFSKVYVLIDNTEKSKAFYNVVFDNIKLKNAWVIYSKLFGYNDFLEMNKKSKKELNTVLGTSKIDNLNLDAKNLEACDIGNLILRTLPLKYANRNILYFENGIYNVATTEYINSFITKYISKNAKSSQKKGAREYIQDILFNDSVEKTNKNYVAFKNGLYDLENYKFIPYSPDIFLKNRLNVNYLEEVPDKNTEADTYVASIMCNNEKRILGYYQIVGYCLTSENDLQVMFIWYGPSASNGKSNATEIVEKMIGKENISHIAIEEFAGKFSNSGIADKLLNVSTEVTDNKVPDISVLKKVITGDLFEGNIKHVQKRLEIKSYAKIIYCANNLPQVKDTTEAYYRRIVTLLFENKFDPKTSTFNVEEFCTQKNLDYIGNVAFRHYLEERKKDKFTFAIEEESEKILMQYKQMNDTVHGYLNDEESIVSRPNFDVNKTAVFEDYKKYCRDNKLIPLPRSKFYLEILVKSDIEEYHPDGYTYYRRKSKEDT